MAPGKRDHYSMLGVSRNASQEEIKRAYLQAAQKLHPDKNTAAGETELFLDSQQAYEVLSNPERRKKYDATLSPEEVKRFPYENKIIFSRPHVQKLKDPQMFYVIMDLAAPLESRRVPSPPLNVCLVLDRSTSMRDEKMDIVKSTAVQVLRSLRSQDILSVVVFSDRAEVIIPASYQQDRERLEARIQLIRPTGGTEIFQGLEAGAKEVMKSLDGKRMSHIILLTDGQTYGDEQKCLDLASKLADRGVGISAMGIGDEWNDIFLDELANRTGGSSAYIAQPSDINRIMMSRFNALAQVYAEDVTLVNQPVEGINLSYAFRIQPDPARISLDQPSLRFGPILQDEPTRVMLEYVVEPTAVQYDTVKIMDAMVKVSISSLPTPVPVWDLQLEHPATDSTDPEPAHPEVVNALSRLMLYRMQEQARSQIENGNVEQGTRQLRQLAANLESQGERSLAQTIMLEVDRLEGNHGLSAHGGKQIKYGTRALFLPAPSKERRS